jgi:hypothetical protein
MRFPPGALEEGLDKYVDGRLNYGLDNGFAWPGSLPVHLEIVSLGIATRKKTQ